MDKLINVSPRKDKYMEALHSIIHCFLINWKARVENFCPLRLNLKL